jgi:hypothetical protein
MLPSDLGEREDRAGLVGPLAPPPVSTIPVLRLLMSLQARAFTSLLGSLRVKSKGGEGSVARVSAGRLAVRFFVSVRRDRKRPSKSAGLQA